MVQIEGRHVTHSAGICVEGSQQPIRSRHINHGIIGRKGDHGRLMAQPKALIGLTWNVPVERSDQLRTPDQQYRGKNENCCRSPTHGNTPL